MEHRSSAVSIESLRYHYGAREALAGVDLQVGLGTVFGLLGPNGGGKTTLFRVLTTYFPVQEGRVTILGFDAATDVDAIRRRIGVVFQSPSLDGKLTVAENLRHQGRLYGLSGSTLRNRAAEMLAQLGIEDRARDRAETLSGGLARRTELAKSLLHRPRLLILDEPSTGLDPGGRRDLWQYLGRLKSDGVTVLLTTHLMDEAEHCDQVGILDAGRLVALGTPDELRAEVGGEVVTLHSSDPLALAERLKSVLDVPVRVVGDTVRLEHPNAYALLPRIGESAGSRIDSLSIAKPTLEDVFVRRTGHRFWVEDDDVG